MVYHFYTDEKSIPQSMRISIRVGDKVSPKCDRALKRKTLHYGKVYISYTNICVYFVWCLSKLVYKFAFTNMPSDVPSSLGAGTSIATSITHDDVIKWKHFLRYWLFVRGIHLSPVNSPHKGQWRGALMFSLPWVWISGWVNNREAGDLRRHRAHYDVTVMQQKNNYLDKKHVAVLGCSLSIHCQEFNNIDILTAYSCTIVQHHVKRSLPLTE